MADSNPLPSKQALLTEQTPLWSQTLGWCPSPAQQEQFEQLYAQILAGNRRLNLTRITNAAEFWDKHLWDSLRGIAPWLAGHGPEVQAQEFALGHDAEGLRVLDIGTGGGFPGVPVAIAQSQWQVTLLDATRKKMAFLTELGQTLGVANVDTICDRSERIGHHTAHRQQYDLALIRAVGPVTVCAEYTLPCLKINGIAVLYRGQWTATEEQTLTQVVPHLGGVIADVCATHTPITRSTRHYIYLQKQQPTPMQYPRAIGIPAKRPL